MTDTTDSTPPFPGFPGFPPAEMLDRMWGMLRLSPFGSALTGAQPGGGLGPSLSMMSDMMAPLTNVEELDKRITDMRAVEQWLKLNLSMLQSAIQALEAPAAQSAASSESAAAQPDNAASAENGEEAPATPTFDASAWWNLLQSQFNQIAQFAMTQPAVAVAAAGGRAATDPEQDAASASAAGSAAAGASPESTDDAKAATKRPAVKRAPAAAKRGGSTSASGSSAKKCT